MVLKNGKRLGRSQANPEVNLNGDSPSLMVLIPQRLRAFSQCRKLVDGCFSQVWKGNEACSGCYDWLNSADGSVSMTSQTGVPISADYFILSLMRLDRDHYQRVEAVRSVTGDDMEHFLFAPNGE